MAHVIGLISDTHGLLRPQVHQALAGVDVIFHAGDVGGEEILVELGVIAPVEAVFGNTDPLGHPGLRPSIERVFDGVRVFVTHGHELGRPKPAQLLARYDADVIVYGHTHRQVIAREEGRLVVNPGAAGARRFDLAPSVARLTIEDGVASAEIIPLV
ncbi:MAG TPA: metallophosphoesterase family protein [Gemmatimonadaceae bacterium]|jgi:putative phosphoesterase|nr:metallophosphoesterase family protein [Gemmatimonadaceae bacterium]